MSVSHAILNLSTSTPTAINPDTVTQSFSGEDRHSYNVCQVYIQNLSSTATVYVGGSGVTSTSYGMAIAPNASASINSLSYTSVLYAVSSAASTIATLLVKS